VAMEGTKRSTAHGSALFLLLALGCAQTTSNAKPTVQAANNTPAQNREIARHMIRTEYAKWDNASQFQCLDDLWHAESRWNHRAKNSRTGACGIPQSYPCDKMAAQGKTYGVDYRRNPWPQIAWGLRYIDKRYGSPCAAWRKFKRGGGY
jgi:hypothetical protein